MPIYVFLAFCQITRSKGQSNFPTHTHREVVVTTYLYLIDIYSNDFYLAFGTGECAHILNYSDNWQSDSLAKADFFANIKQRNFLNFNEVTAHHITDNVAEAVQQYSFSKEYQLNRSQSVKTYSRIKQQCDGFADIKNLPTHSKLSVIKLANSFP